MGAAALVIGLHAFLLRDAAGAAGSPKRRNTAWLAAGSLLALLPVMKAVGTPRLLFIPSIGFAAVLALALDTLLRWARASGTGQTRSLLRRALPAVGGAFAAAFGVALLLGGGRLPRSGRSCSTGRISASCTSTSSSRRGRGWPPARAEEAPPPAAGPEETIVLMAPYLSVFWPLCSEFTHVIDENGQRVRVKHLSFLSTARSDHEVLRTGEDTFRLTLRESKRFPWAQAVDFPWFDSLQVCNLPVADLQPAGARIETRTLRVDVREVVQEERYRSIDVTRLTPAESTWYAVWRQGALHRIRLPEPGERMLLSLDLER